MRPLSGTEIDRGMAIACNGKELLVAGYTASSDLSFSGIDSKGGYEIFVYRLDSDGVPLWWTGLGSTGWDRVTGIVPLSGGFAVSGYTDKADGDFESFSTLGDCEAFVARFG